MRRSPLWILASLAAFSCARATPAPPAPPCPSTPVDATEWELVERGAFSFRLPPGYRPVAVRAVDSRVERWTAGRLRAVSFDAGQWSSTLQEFRGKTGYTECREAIGGREALIVSGWDANGTMHEPGRKYIVAATWRDIRPGYHLTLSGITPSRREQQVLLAVLRSVRFRQ